jgi:hypothetical protein
VIWKPFSSKGLEEKCAAAREVLETVSRMYAVVLPLEESAWRNLTYKGLDAIFTSETDTGVVEAAVDEVIKVLKPLVQPEKMAKFREELSCIFHEAATIWEDMRVDSRRISVLASPPEHAEPGQYGWKTTPSPSFGPPPTPAKSEAENLKPWCLFPQIQAESTTGERSVLFPGYALFPDSPVVARGLLERHEIEEKFDGMTLSDIISPPTSVTLSKPPLGLAKD